MRLSLASTATATLVLSALLASASPDVHDRAQDSSLLDKRQNRTYSSAFFLSGAPPPPSSLLSVRWVDESERGGLSVGCRRRPVWSV